MESLNRARSKFGSYLLGRREPAKVLEKVDGIEHKFCVWRILTVATGIGAGMYKN